MKFKFKVSQDKYIPGDKRLLNALCDIQSVKIKLKLGNCDNYAKCDN